MRECIKKVDAKLAGNISLGGEFLPLSGRITEMVTVGRMGGWRGAQGGDYKAQKLVFKKAVTLLELLVCY